MLTKSSASINMIWGWLAFLVLPAAINWKEEKHANSNTSIAAVFILPEPCLKQNASSNKFLNILKTTADRELANIISEETSRNVNINTSFSLTLCRWCRSTPTFVNSTQRRSTRYRCYLTCDNHVTAPCDTFDFPCHLGFETSYYSFHVHNGHSVLR